MRYFEKLQILTISAWQLVALMAILVAFVILYMKAKRTASLKAFFSVLAALALWLIGKILKTVSPTIELRWSSIVLYYFAICWLEVALLEFGFIYYKGNIMRPGKRILLYILPLIQFIIIATNPAHHLFYSRFTFTSDSFGPLFYLHVFIEYIYILGAILLCRYRLRKQLKFKSKGYKFVIFFAMIAPIVLNILYISRVLQDVFERLNIKVIFDLTPIVFTWSALLFVYAAYKYEFFDMTPIMKHRIVQSLDKPICIVDTNADILFMNERMQICFDYNERSLEVFDMLKSVREKITKEEYRSTVNDPFRINDKVYMYYSRCIRNLEGVRYLIIFNETTASINAKEKLSSNNKKLEKINKELNEQIMLIESYSKLYAGRFVARELHDILGHSLVVAMKLLEVAKLSGSSREKTVESLERAQECMDTGLDELKSVNIQDDKKESGIILKNTINKIVHELDELGLVVNFFFKGEDKPVDSGIIDVLRNVITELSTNVLKHSKASNLLVSAKVSDKYISITMMDNGIGTKEIVPGNGLKGIMNRLKSINGDIEFKSELNEGFTGNILITL